MEFIGNFVCVHINIFIFAHCLYLKDFVQLGKLAFVAKTEMKMSAE